MARSLKFSSLLFLTAASSFESQVGQPHPFSPDYSPAERIGRSSLGSSILGFPVFARLGLDGGMRRRVWGCGDGILGAGTRPSAQVTNRARRVETTVKISSTRNT